MALVPCYRGSANAWECDENDHLNVRFYLAKANQGLPFVLEAAGLSPAALEAAGLRPRIRAQHVRFLREARPATPLTVHAGLVEAEGAQLKLYAEVRHSLGGEVLATLLTELIFADAAGDGQPVSPSPDAPRTGVPEHGAPRGIDAAGRPLRPDHGSIGAMGFVEIGRGSVAASECDAAGEMEPFQYVGRMSDSVVNLLAHFQTGEELSRRSHGAEGGALVELRVAWHSPLRAGSLFTIQSGIAAVGRKTQNFVHLFFDEGSRACVATARAVAVAMDLRTRRAIDLPEARRRRIEEKLLRLPR
ncbi:MAG TPA: thioesterase family protein [Myxococcales bacterium]|nr:thioesterase family protein [Myxococcales bacterium]